MKMVRLELTNFGPFRGQQTLDLTVSPEAPVVLVHGENMRGKTSIRNQSHPLVILGRVGPAGSGVVMIHSGGVRARDDVVWAACCAQRRTGQS